MSDELQLYQEDGDSKVNKYPKVKIEYAYQDLGGANQKTLPTVLSEKVDKVAGKDLSTNDFTNDFKTKLTEIEAKATKNTITLNGTETKEPKFYATTSVGIKGQAIFADDNGLPYWQSMASSVHLKSPKTGDELKALTTMAHGDMIYCTTDSTDTPKTFDKDTYYLYIKESETSTGVWYSLGSSIDLSAYQLKNVGVASKVVVSGSDKNITTSTIASADLNALAGYGGSTYDTATKRLTNYMSNYDTLTANATSGVLGSATRPIYITGGKLTAGTALKEAAYRGVATGIESSSADLVPGGVILSYASANLAPKTALTDGSVTKVGTATVGSASQPVYLNAGTITKCSSTVGSTTQLVYMSSGNITKGISITSGTADPSGTPAGGVGSIYIKYTA